MRRASFILLVVGSVIVGTYLLFSSLEKIGEIERAALAPFVMGNVVLDLTALAGTFRQKDWRMRVSFILWEISSIIIGTLLLLYSIDLIGYIKHVNPNPYVIGIVILDIAVLAGLFDRLHGSRVRRALIFLLILGLIVMIITLLFAFLTLKPVF